MRDDLFPLSRPERRAALAGWRAVPASIRWETGRLAEKGLPARDPAVSAAARRYGQLLLQKNLSNRLPRCTLSAAGAFMLAAGLLFLTSSFWAATAVPATLIAAGVVVTALGFLSWGQRRIGRLLVATNSSVVEPAARWD
ncbi:MAG TPA: hypothetical protein VK402_06280 [Blastococcus sp.]|nr:hypothetical protein [Blastococcus sp.]